MFKNYIYENKKKHTFVPYTYYFLYYINKNYILILDIACIRVNCFYTCCGLDMPQIGFELYPVDLGQVRSTVIMIIVRFASLLYYLVLEA